MPRGVCVVCEKEKTVHRDKASRELVCAACRVRTKTNGVCADCGKRRALPYRNSKTKKRICHPCHAADIGLEPCSLCQKMRPVTRRTSGLPVCRTCDAREFHRGECPACGRTRALRYRSEAGEHICEVCYRQVREAATDTPSPPSPP